MIPLEPLDALLARASLPLKPLSAPLRPRVLPVLARARAFPEGFWHPEDVESGLEVMEARLEELGIDPEVLRDLPAAADGAGDVTEDEERRHAIGRALRHVNAALASGGRPERFHAFADEGLVGWESDEPVWLLLTAEERARVLEGGLLEEPTGIEAAYTPRAEK
jgi:hypothetical protein